MLDTTLQRLFLWHGLWTVSLGGPQESMGCSCYGFGSLTEVIGVVVNLGVSPLLLAPYPVIPPSATLYVVTPGNELGSAKDTPEKPLRLFQAKTITVTKVVSRGFAGDGEQVRA